MSSTFPAYVAFGHEDGSEVELYTPEGGASAISPGDFWYYDTTSNTAKICGADPALIAGLSEVEDSDAAALTPDGKVPLRIITGARCVIALSSTTTPAESHVGDQYGITLTGGIWQLDTSKTGADARVLVKRVDIGSGTFFCQVLNDQLQFGAVA